MAGIKGYRPSRQNAKLHKDRNEPRQVQTKFRNLGEPEIVLVSELAPVVNAWINRWTKDRPMMMSLGNAATESATFYGPMKYISENSGVNPRRIYMVCKMEMDRIGLSQAEKILQAIDREYMLATGEIQVLPNPNWKMAKWVEYMRERGVDLTPGE
jgi:hypothetical protein